MSRLVSLLLLACSTKSSTVIDNRSDDPEDPTETADECDDYADQVICRDGLAITCNGAGDIVEQDRCTDQTLSLIHISEPTRPY